MWFEVQADDSGNRDTESMGEFPDLLLIHWNKVELWAKV